jgi:hypothetical protein
MDPSSEPLFDAQSPRRWLAQFGEIGFPGPDAVSISSGAPVQGGVHAEAHCEGLLGADFTYLATIACPDWVASELSADLQFWISDEGRYGVRLQAELLTVYRFALPRRQCADDPKVFAHCPLWPDDGDPSSLDALNFERLAWVPMNLPSGAPVTVMVTVRGTRVSVSLDGSELLLAEAGARGVGRFGVYAFATSGRLEVLFSGLSASHDPTAASNLALLYSTVGYDAVGTKRAILRTLNDLPVKYILGQGSHFTVRNAAGLAAIDARPLMPDPGWLAGQRTFGMQQWPMDFSDLDAPGTYTLEVVLNTTSGPLTVLSDPFRIAPRLVSASMLKPLSILNAQARRAAEEDLRRNWQIEAGREAWSVGLDGSFFADRADDGNGAILKRVLDCGNGGLTAREFRYLARVTIVDGCDAQLQFWITPLQRWGVTLQAGAAGGCRYGSGPGAVRLHREGDGFFEPLASALFPVPGFVTGHPYDVEIRVGDGSIVVLVDGATMIEYMASPPGDPVLQLGVKAWASTARFEHVQAWSRQVALSRPVPGVVIPYFTATNTSPLGIRITVPDTDSPRSQPEPHPVLYPLMTQLHGYHDCNNFIGEATSHGVFLAGLMDVWTKRAHAFASGELDDLRRSILTAVLYLQDLWEQGNRTGQFAHQEPGRGAMEPGNAIANTQCAIYGLASFAELGAAVNLPLARGAVDLVLSGQEWLGANGGSSVELDSIVFSRLANAAVRDGRPESEDWGHRARAAATQVLCQYSQTDALARSMRAALRSLPWFEGVHHVFGNKLDASARTQVDSIATQLRELAENPSNGFRVIPEATDGGDPPTPGLPARNWHDLSDIPLAVAPIPEPAVGDWYITEHFATAAADCVFIGQVAGEPALEQLATGNLQWITGLNPGVPASKIAAVRHPTVHAWSAASFMYNGPGAFARTIEGFRTRSSSSKGWAAPWEESADSPHRETWWIDPLPNGFQTIVNGHILRERQWHYWSVGVGGWVSGETFLLIDGSFLKASLALEDWHAGQAASATSPYDVTRPLGIDATHVDRTGTGWDFDDPERTPWAQAARMAHEFGVGKGFAGGRPTGHHIGERVGVLCVPASAQFIDVSDDEVIATPWSFDDINTALWAQVARTATEIAVLRLGFVGGYFTGHQLDGRRGLVGLNADIAEAIAVSDDELAKSQWAFTDINTVGWAQAARAATEICVARGFAGGFFTGHQVPGRRGIVALLA